MMTTPTPKQVLDVFAELTGIVFRRCPDTVTRQAADFAASFTFEELELVIEFTRHQMKNGGVSYNAQSLTWLKLMGDYGASNAFLVFQERLGIAMEAVKRKTWRPRLRFDGNERRAVAEPAPKPGGQPASAEWHESEEARAKRQQALEEFKRTVNR